MIAVTAASGHLGRLVVTGLLDAGVPAAEVVAVVRAPEKVADLAARGVQVRRADYAAGAVAVLTADDPKPGVYELGGSAPFTLAELAAEISRQAGREVTYTDLPTDGHVQALVGVGLDEGTAGFVAAIDAGIAAG